MISTLSGDDAPLQPYSYRLHPLEDTPAYIHTHQYLAHLGLLHQVDEASNEVLRH